MTAPGIAFVRITDQRDPPGVCAYCAVRAGELAALLAERLPGVRLEQAWLELPADVLARLRVVLTGPLRGVRAGIGAEVHGVWWSGLLAGEEVRFTSPSTSGGSRPGG